MCNTIERMGEIGVQPLGSVATFDDQRLKIENPDQESSVSDSESCVRGSASDSYGRPDLFKGGLLKLVEEEDRVYGLIKHRFLSGLGDYLSPKTTVVAIHKKNWFDNFAAQAKIQSFEIIRRLMERERHGNGDGCLKFAWFGTSRDEVDQIMSHGFGHCQLNNKNGLYGHGVYLSPGDSPFESVQSADVDENGLRHVLLCRVLLGKMEVIHPGSEQTHPSSEEFDSGVDSLESPRKYIVWSTNMNTHILPEYVVSFRAPLCLRNGNGEKVKKPTSPWMPFLALLQELGKVLPPQSVSLISKYHKDYKERRISRNQLIKLIRQLAGDKPLVAVVKSWRDKNQGASFNKGERRF